MSRSNFLDRLLQVSPATAPFITASLSGLRGAAGGRGGSGSNGQPGGGGGGGKGGRPGEESLGNNLSFPAIFPVSRPSSLPTSPLTDFLFTTPYNSSPVGPYHFAQGIPGNTWEAESITDESASSEKPLVVNGVDIGDALETAPLRANSNVRLELTLYQNLAEDLIGFNMTLLDGAKGKGKPSQTGPTELQGARLDPSFVDEEGLPYSGSRNEEKYENAIFPTTYKSSWASIYAGESSWMNLSIQKVKDGLTGVEDLTWSANGYWESDDDTIITNKYTLDGQFGPELNIAGKYIAGASGTPWQFPEEGTYLITFSVNDSAPIAFDGSTKVGNYDAAMQELPVATGRPAQVIPDGDRGTDGADTHNGLIYMLMRVPSSVTEAG